MSFEAGMLISVPATELPFAQASASLFELSALTGAAFSPPLRNALPLLEECVPAEAPKLVVARPEIFTHGVTLQWLNAYSHGVEDHMCLSDGSTIRLLPGYRNHVFFYGLGAVAHVEALARLERRTPEIFTQLHSQFNTAMKFCWKDKVVGPQTYAVLANFDGAPQEPGLRPLVINRYSIDDSVARTLQSQPIDFPAPPFSALQCLRISESGLRNKEVARRIVTLVADSLVDPSQQVVIVLPYANGADTDLAARVRLLVESLFDGDARLPGVAAPNIFAAAADPPIERLRATRAVKRLALDDFADFWRSPPHFYESFDEISVYARRRRHIPSQFQELLELAYGPRVKIDWLRAPCNGGGGP